MSLSPVSAVSSCSGTGSRSEKEKLPPSSRLLTAGAASWSVDLEAGDTVSRSQLEPALATWAPDTRRWYFRYGLWGRVMTSPEA